MKYSTLIVTIITYKEWPPGGAFKLMHSATTGSISMEVGDLSISMFYYSCNQLLIIHRTVKPTTHLLSR